MIKSEIYSLSKPQIGKKQKIDKKLINDLKSKVCKIIKIFNAYLIENCEVFTNFTGRDIDALYEKKKNSYKIKLDSIIRNLDNNSIRIHLNHPNHVNFLSLDFEDIAYMPIAVKNIFEKNLNVKIFCKHTKINHLDDKSIIFYKIVKYFYNGTIHSYSQLSDLKKKIKKLDRRDLKLIIDSVDEALPNEREIIKKFLSWEFSKFYKNQGIKRSFNRLRSKRHKRRRIFYGKLSVRKLIFSKKFFYAFFFGSFAKWNYSHYSMPAISIVGNDGSGKTTLVEYIRKNFSKMDPLILSMKSSEPFFSISLKIVNKIKRIKELKLIKNFFFLNFFFSIIGELLNLFDKFIKYKIGMAWADAGYGLTIFERYPTDRIRGEFPSKKNKWFPLEQFFPLPDGFVYLDALPIDSVYRKKKDNHSLDEMRSKRKNYLSLLEEFNEVKILPSSKNIKSKIIKMKNYIFILYLKKNRMVQKNRKIERVKWKKNYNRVLAGNNLNKSQKESFFE